MKFPKILIAAPLLFSLIGCGSNQGYAGKYSFQLGTNEGTHAAISITLEDNPYENADEDIKQYNPKTFKLHIDINGVVIGGDSSNTSENSSSEAISSEEELLIENPFTDFSWMTGYYYTDGKQEKTGELLHLGIDILDQYTISPRLTEKIIYATVNSSEINVVIPVSFNDLFYQLYWYGYRIASLIDVIEPVNVLEENPDFAPFFVGNDIGTHPTPEAIQAIKDYQNKRYETKPEGYDDSEEIFNNYHDFHTLNMGLKKNA